MKAQGIFAGMGGSSTPSEHGSAVRLCSFLQKHFPFKYWSALGWYLKAWQTQTITIWRTWISWVFLLTFWTTMLPSFQWPLHVVKAVRLCIWTYLFIIIIPITCLFGYAAIICHPAQCENLLIWTDTKRFIHFCMCLFSYCLSQSISRYGLAMKV